MAPVQGTLKDELKRALRMGYLFPRKLYGEKLEEGLTSW